MTFLSTSTKTSSSITIITITASITSHYHRIIISSSSSVRLRAHLAAVPAATSLLPYRGSSRASALARVALLLALQAIIHSEIEAAAVGQAARWTAVASVAPVQAVAQRGAWEEVVVGLCGAARPLLPPFLPWLPQARPPQRWVLRGQAVLNRIYKDKSGQGWRRLSNRQHTGRRGQRKRSKRH